MASDPPSWQALLGLGTVIAATLVIGMGLGWLVDSLLDTVPVFILVGLVLGIVAAGSYTYARFRQYLQR